MEFVGKVEDVDRVVEVSRREASRMLIGDRNFEAPSNTSKKFEGDEARLRAETLGDDRFWAVEEIEVFITVDFEGGIRHHQRGAPFPNTWEFIALRRKVENVVPS